jgi:hypothetical protein
MYTGAKASIVFKQDGNVYQQDIEAFFISIRDCYSVIYIIMAAGSESPVKGSDVRWSCLASSPQNCAASDAWE